MQCSIVTKGYTVVLQLWHMSHTLTIRLQRELADWLEAEADRTGVSQGQIVREQLEQAKASAKQPFMRLAGAMKGPKDLSTRKGFSTV